MKNLFDDDLPMDDCDFSGLPQRFCDHCTGDEEPEEKDFEITAVFDAKFSGRCSIDDDHIIRRGDRVGFIQHADNPMLPIRGVACKACVISYPSAKK